MSRPAEQLVGLTIEGYHIKQRLTHAPDMTGGCNSICYLAEKDGTEFFLKATDVTFVEKEHDGEDDARTLERFLSIYNYERDLLSICRREAMTHVVRMEASGAIPFTVGGGAQPIRISVYFLVFERAKMNLREWLHDGPAIEPIDRLRALHHAVVGLKQLHTQGIAQQDMKPSNVVGYTSADGSITHKVSDLGQGNLRGRPSYFDTQTYPGDPVYAPIEMLYVQPADGFDRRRLGADLYLFGSLILQVFTGVGMTSSLLSELPETHHPANWGEPYAKLMPRLRDALDKVMQRAWTAWPFPHDDPEIPVMLDAAVRQLCDPDPYRRGDPAAANTVNPVDLQRYVSLMARLIQRATVAETLAQRRLAELAAE